MSGEATEASIGRAERQTTRRSLGEDSGSARLPDGTASSDYEESSPGATTRRSAERTANKPLDETVAHAQAAAIGPEHTLEPEAGCGVVPPSRSQRKAPRAMRRLFISPWHDVIDSAGIGHGPQSMRSKMSRTSLAQGVRGTAGTASSSGNHALPSTRSDEQRRSRSKRNHPIEEGGFAPSGRIEPTDWITTGS